MNHGGQRPKLPEAKREVIRTMTQRRRILTKLIAELQDERRKIPTIRQMCQQFGVTYNPLRRIVIGDPYKNQHPEDEQAA